MKNIINISLSFPQEQTATVSPVVNSVNIYPLKRGGVSNFISHANWALEFHSRDSGFIEFRDNPGIWHKRCANFVHIYSPACHYREDSRDADFPLEENYFIFTGGESCGFHRLIGSGSFAAISDPENKAGSLMRKAGELCESNGVRAFWEVQALFMKIIQILSSARKTKTGIWQINQDNDNRSFVDEVELYLRKNLSNNINISDVARYMKVSKSSLTHRFKNDANTPLIARLIEIRIDFAKSLLLKGEKLNTIADMTGFHDEYHLSKTFKKQIGFSPREFKNQQDCIN